MKRAVIFDLDGTLWDAVGPLTDYWNEVRHVTGVAQFAVAFNELGLGNLVINGIPSYVDMAADIGQFLAPD